MRDDEGFEIGPVVGVVSEPTELSAEDRAEPPADRVPVAGKRRLGPSLIAQLLETLEEVCMRRGSRGQNIGEATLRLALDLHPVELVGADRSKLTADARRLS